MVERKGTPIAKSLVRGDSASTVNLQRLVEHRSASTANFQAVTAQRPASGPKPASTTAPVSSQTAGGGGTDKPK